MISLRVLWAYILWHYGRGFSELAHFWASIILFINHFFSIPLLIRTLFSPWRRMGEATRRGGLHIGDYFGDLVVGLLMRIVGFAVRMPTIIIGCIFLIGSVLLFPVLFLVWLLLPPFALLLIVFGLYYAAFGL